MPLAVSALTTTSFVSFGDARNLPAIFTAEADAGSSQRLLVVTNTGTSDSQNFTAELIRAQGLTLDSVSTAYRFGQASNTTETEVEISNLVANLVSANGKSIKVPLKNLEIGYILVPNQSGNGDLALSLNTVSELDQVGTTEFGQLWRVRAATNNKAEEVSIWSITKGIQFGVLVSFMLLALPTSRGRKSRSTGEFVEENSFIEEEEGN